MRAGQGDPRLAARGVLERDVGRVAAVGELDDVLGRRLDPVEQRVDGDALPDGVELRPLCDAVDVDGDLLAGQSLELLPGPPARLVDLADDREVPAVERRMWRRACGEDGEVPGHVLAGRHAVAGRVVAAAPEASGDDRRHVPS
jgi:hypothetical protein